MSVEISLYKDKWPTMKITDDQNEKRFISFGLAKAKLILAHWEAIKMFVDSDGQNALRGFKADRAAQA